MKALGFEFLAALVGLATYFVAMGGGSLTVVLGGGILTLNAALLAVSSSIQASRTSTVDRPEPACNRLGTAGESQAHMDEIRHTLETAPEGTR